MDYVVQHSSLALPEALVSVLPELESRWDLTYSKSLGAAENKRELDGLQYSREPVVPQTKTRGSK